MPLVKVVVRCAFACLSRSPCANASSQVSNTVCQTEHFKTAQGKLEVMDISPVLAESIRRVRLFLRLLVTVAAS